MAIPTDYLSRPFGSFVLDELVGSGRDAEAYRCVHVPNGLIYIARLGIDEDRLWEGPPILPPPNGATERKTVEISWLVSGQAWADGKRTHLVHTFRIVDARDVIPLSAPKRVRGGWSITDARSLPPPDGELGSMFSLYDEAVGMMYADAALGEANLREWRSKWRLLSGGPHLMSKVDPLIEAGELLPTGGRADAARSLRTKLASHAGRRLELAENVLLKLCQAVAVERLDWNAFEGTLRCPFFRLNVHAAEIEQFLLLQEVFAEPEEHHYQSEQIERARQWVAVTLGLLAEEALHPRTAPDRFEVRETEPPEVLDDWVVLQEYAATTPSLFEAVNVLVSWDQD
jgi:hypothetical protein